MFLRAQRELEQQQKNVQQREKAKPSPPVEKSIDPAIQAELDAQQERNKVFLALVLRYNKIIN